MDGVADIKVVSAEGTTRHYKRMFELELANLQLEEEFPDGIYEPGERIALRRIAFTNTEQMPSPSKPAVFSLWERGGVSAPSSPVRVQATKPLSKGSVASARF